MSRIASLLLLIPLASCSADPAPETTANAVDPAITAAISDPIMADPQLDRRANRDVLRPDDDPFRAMFPPGSPQLARRKGAVTLAARMEPAMKGAGDAFIRCDTAVRYSYRWAADLPSELTLPSEAQVTEAAGHDTATCRLRLVAFASSAAPEAVIGQYRDAARGAGYRLSEAAQGGATMITARRSNGDAFVARIEPGSGGSLVDLVTNRGR